MCDLTGGFRRLAALAGLAFLTLAQPARAQGITVSPVNIDVQSHSQLLVELLDGQHCAMDFDYREVRAAQAIIENARKVILVADAIKFTRSAPVRIAHISEIDIFVTDRALPQPVADACRKSDVRVEIVESPEGQHELPLD